MLVVLDLDRLGRLAGELVQLIDALAAREVGFRALNAPMDTTTPQGRAFLQIQAAFAEMERNLLRERTKAGLAAARARGRLGGRKPRLSADGLDTARRLMADPMLGMEEVAARVGVGRTTLYRALSRAAARVADDVDAGDGAGHDEGTGRRRRTPGRKPRPSSASAT